MLRLGLIGYGLWGKYHAAALAQAGDVRLAAIACASAATATQARADHPGVSVLIGYAALLAQTEIDAVAIVTPNHLHAEICIAALEAGKDVLLEKPMATSVADCARINQAARRAGRTVSLVHQFRLSTQWGAIKGWIDAGDIGEPLYANTSLFRFPYRGGSGGWRNQRDKVGSWILEEPVHFFDNVMWYFERLGDPVAVRACGNSRVGVAGMNENFSCHLRWRGGAYASITQTLIGFENHQVVEVTGTEGSIRTWWSGASDRTPHPSFEMRRRRRGSEHAEVVSIGPSGEVIELAETYRRIGTAFRSKQALVSGDEAIKRIHVCLQAERSLATGQELELVF